MKRTTQHTWFYRFRRRGTFVVVGLFALIAVVGIVALNVDTGIISLEKTRLQNAVDAAALAAAQEISAAVEEAGENGDAGDANAIAVGAARTMAAHVAELNGVYVDPERDVRFGKRIFDEATGTFSIAWDTPPYNVVQVTARRDNPDAEAPDSELQLLFAPVVGRDSLGIVASAIAFVEARDLVLVLDYSASMNDDSEFVSIGKLTQSSIEENMQNIFTALGPPNVGSMTFEPQYMSQTETTSNGDVTVTFKYKSIHVEADSDLESIKLGFSNGNTQTFNNVSGTSGTFSGTGSNNNKTINWCTVETIDDSAGDNSVSTPYSSSSGANADISVTFPGGNSVSVQSNENLYYVKLYFTDGSKQTNYNVSGNSATVTGSGSYYYKTVSRVKVKVNGGEWQKFADPSGGGGNTVETQFNDTTSNVKECFGLNNVAWPYPSGSWDSFIDHCRGDGSVYNAGYRRMYGGACLVDYLLGSKPAYSQCPDLWKTPHYPFHAMKEGTTLFTQFLSDLNFGDHVGLVTYATYSKVQTGLDEEGIPETVDLGDELITNDYAAIDTIQRHKQAGHFASTTGLGYGLEDARELLASHGRYGARPTILLMTDGLANQSPNGWQLPGDWDWAAMTDFDGDGSADYTTSNRHKQYALYQAKLAIDAGYTIHTMSVGAGADRDLMEAIAAAGMGIWIDVPGGSTVAELEEQMLAAFSRVAANVPPAKLLIDPNAE